MAKTALKLIMHACPRCGGAAYLEDPRDGDWRCLQCARTVPNANIEALRRSTELNSAA
jgi:tRNA(Ile2) C34 agmatinyltransferase TiaS